MTDTFRNQLSEIVAAHQEIDEKYKHEPPGDVISGLQMRCLAAVERVAGRQSAYYRMAQEINKEDVPFSYRMQRLVGVVRALLSDLDQNYLDSFGEIMREDVFADYLEMASHLLEKGYKDAAAVLAGSTLEVHLRNLCVKSSIETGVSGGHPKKADRLNAELYKAGAYSNLVQKSVTAWLSLRNDAAHGHYSTFEAPQVRLLVAEIQDFVRRHPA